VLPIAPPDYVDKGPQPDVNLRIVSSFAGDALAAVPFATDHPEAELRLVQSALSEIILALVRGVLTRLHHGSTCFLRDLAQQKSGLRRRRKWKTQGPRGNYP
jgi:hypothetical protein